VWEWENKKLGSFLDELGSASSVPGGGVAAGLTAAAGLCLLEMVVRLNDKRLKEKSPKIRLLIKSRARIMRLMRLDAQAFSAISKSWKTGRRDASFQNALKSGASVPLEMCRIIEKIGSIFQTEKNRTSRWLLSDLKESGILLEAAFRAARLNVEINLADMADEGFARQAKNELDRKQKKIIFCVGKLFKGAAA
jgi:formiminotetrahydrofolate cyclodeaminase